MNRIKSLIIGLTLSVGAAIPSFAQIVSHSGQVAWLAIPPTSVVEGNHESNRFASIFVEQSGMYLPSSVQVDANGPGNYNHVSTLGNYTIAAGTYVQVYLLHTDPVGRPTVGLRYQGSITFAHKILGVQALKSTLDAHDALLGAVGTTYPGVPGDWRGWELPPDSDIFSISADGKTLTFDCTTFDAIDQLRIITEGVVPEPGSMLALATALVGLVRKRKQRRA